jgi:hypothetical protein
LYFPDNRPHDISNESDCISGGFGFVDVERREADFKFNRYLILLETDLKLTDIFSGKKLLNLLSHKKN